MLSEAITKIVELSREAHALTFQQHPDLHDTVWVRYAAGGETHVEEKRKPAPLRCHNLAGLDDLIAAVKDPVISPSPEVYVDDCSIVVLLDRAERRSIVSVDLRHTDRLSKCIELQRPLGLQPRDVVKMLRMDLHGGNVEHVIQALSKIDFKRTVGGTTDVAHGRETLGRGVEAAVQQADKVPKDFTLAVPVWSNPGFNRYVVNVQFGIYLDLETQVVELRVLNDEISRVLGLATTALAKDLTDALGSVPVFLGVP